MGKYSKSVVPIVAAVGAVLADGGIIATDMLGEFTNSIVTILIAVGVISIPVGKNYDGKW